MVDTVDIVITWVNGDDPKWNNKKNQYSNEIFDKKLNSKERYYDYNTLKYFFRSVEKNASFINKVFLITDNQIPRWLDIDNKKVKIINHQDFIPSKYLPTFNSNVIESNIFRIEDLSENFILFNDDMLITRKMNKSDFFKNNLPVDAAIQHPLIANIKFDNIRLNNMVILNNKFNKRDILKKHFFKFYNYKYGLENLKNLSMLPYSNFSGFEDFHLPIAYKKSELKKVYLENKSHFDDMFKSKFRTSRDINQWLFRYYRLCLGQFTPGRILGKYYTVKEVSKIKYDFKKNKKIKMICINDTGNADEDCYSDVNHLLNYIFPNKSEFEL